MIKKKNIKISEEDITLREFVELLDWLDKSKEGQNLRMYPDGSSYIVWDNGYESDDFNDIYELVRYLKELKRKYESGELVPIVWE